VHAPLTKSVTAAEMAGGDELVDIMTPLLGC
jgi:hypothetical protein